LLSKVGLRSGAGVESLAAAVHQPGDSRDSYAPSNNCGRICWQARKINFSHVFAGQKVGITQVGERVWLVTFMQYDLGYFDDETCRLEPVDNPFGPKVLPMCAE
jgi:putative transposase